MAVKKGFSWPAFFFTWIWAFTKRLFGVGGLLLAMHIRLLALREDAALAPFAFVIDGALVIVMGAFANNLWRRKLRRRGYHDAGDVIARSSKAAFDAFTQSQASCACSASPSTGEPNDTQKA